MNQWWLFVNWTLVNKIQWNLNQNTTIFIQENNFENAIYKMVAISLDLSVLVLSTLYKVFTYKQ